MNSNSQNKNDIYFLTRRIMDTEFTGEASPRCWCTCYHGRCKFPLFSYMGPMGALQFHHSSQLCDFKILSPDFLFKPTEDDRRTSSQRKLLVERDRQLENMLPFPPPLILFILCPLQQTPRNWMGRLQFCCVKASSNF